MKEYDIFIPLYFCALALAAVVVLTSGCRSVSHVKSDSVDLTAKRQEIAVLQAEINMLTSSIDKLDLDLALGKRESLVPYTTEARAIELERNIALLRKLREQLRAREKELEHRYEVRRH